MKPLSTEQIQRIHEIPPDSGIYYTLYTDAQRLEEQLEAAVRLGAAHETYQAWHAAYEVEGAAPFEDGEELWGDVLESRKACIAIGLGAKLKLEG